RLAEHVRLKHDPVEPLTHLPVGEATHMVAEDLGDGAHRGLGIVVVHAAGEQGTSGSHHDPSVRGGPAHEARGRPDQPLTAPSSTPWKKNFWKNAKNTMIGTSAIMVPAATTRGSEPKFEFRYSMPTVRVYFAGSVSTISGHRKSSHPPMKAKIATTLAIPRTLGQTMVRSTCQVLAPSITAASRSSLGIARQAALISSTLIAPTRPGRITPPRVLARPSVLIVRNWLISVTSPGSSRVDSRISIARRF